MDLIVSHDRADFDALAAQVAASKLYAGATVALPPSLAREVRPYLGLHRDRLGFVPIGDIDLARVERLILVDVRSASRLSHIAPLLARRGESGAGLEVCIYDHHPAREDDVAGDVEVVERVGSATTLLLERIRQRRIPLDVLEATLFALGIHTDTGSLTFPSSTPRDARALAFLLESGAALEVVHRYLHTAFKLSQRRVMAELLEAAEVRSIGGFRVAVAGIGLRADEASGLDEVTTRVFEALGCHALFAIYEVRPRKLQIIARARSGLVDVGSVLGVFGGGGHAAAGAASVRDADLAETRERLLVEIGATLPKLRRARDIMSSPVHVVSPDTPLTDLREGLLLWKHTGACVTRDGSLVAVVSRRDLERAERARGTELAVKSFMSQKLVTTEADAPLEEVISKMEREDVGRLPVLDGRRLVGIVTRSDVLQALYEGSAP
jgi:tRNA nucleotidyltransferase (CCA-adding enzyme)